MNRRQFFSGAVAAPLVIPAERLLMGVPRAWVIDPKVLLNLTVGGQTILFMRNDGTLMLRRDGRESELCVIP